jgi:hypothetical protein
MAGAYWETLVQAVGDALAGDFLAVCAGAFAQSKTEEELPRHLDKRVMHHSMAGPVARNLISMWYLGQWNALPREWCDAFGAMAADCTRMVSSQAYQEGLVWPAFGAHPQGAKPTGWGSWAEPPFNAAEVLRLAGA